MTAKQVPFEIVDDRVAAILRGKRDSERLHSVDAAWRSARVILKAAIVTEHPDWDSPQVDQEIARRISNGVIDDVLGNT